MLMAGGRWYNKLHADADLDTNTFFADFLSHAAGSHVDACVCSEHS